MNAECSSTISIRQPFATLVVRGVKRFEARSWPVTGGPLLVHASQNLAVGWRSDEHVCAALVKAGVALKDVTSLPRSAIVGAVKVGRCIGAFKAPRTVGRLTELDRYLCADDGYVEDGYLWQLGSPVEFQRPVGVSGKLQLWEPPPSVLRRALAQLPRSY